MRHDLYSIRSKKGLEIILRQFYQSEWENDLDDGTDTDDLSRFVEDCLPSLTCTIDSGESYYYLNISLLVKIKKLTDEYYHWITLLLTSWESSDFTTLDAIDWLWGAILMARDTSKTIIKANKQSRITI